MATSTQKQDEQRQEALRLAVEASRKRKDESRRLILEACRRLQGVRELTASVLAEETGLGTDTCRVRRDELLKAGLIRKTWKDYSMRARRDGLGASAKDHPIIQARTEKVWAAKWRIGGGALNMRTLAQILPS